MRQAEPADLVRIAKWEFAIERLGADSACPDETMHPLFRGRIVAGATQYIGIGFSAAIFSSGSGLSVLE